MIIGLLLIFLVVLPLVYFAFTKIKPMPNCFDRRKNGNEVGIDCGGACVLQCPYTKKDVVVIFARAQKVADGLYNAIALVENKNTDAFAQSVSYTFKLYDEHNIPVAIRNGQTYINPNTRQVIFKGGINVGKHEVGRVVVEFTKPITWFSTSLGSYVLPLAVSESNYRVINDKPMLNYTLENTGYDTIPAGNSVVVVYDSENNATAFSSTIMDSLKPFEKQIVVFSWPSIFKNGPFRFELYNQVNLAEFKNKQFKK
ncbi:hypothetical protein A3J61_02035 [Candidatus Nomurabacteria bacterium RIFCSPHIGHO2_02_FULL_38_15]|uniref:Uncharacterized protein n=1 Tax=Candidatus Nomurabacteria bacterium RIFCSPHIGHO2_02_FULL_38_15 TaxID=1801752 RepID=A0A1F6VS22_9BACT|nr:MAG: hypothetical protein A3J61_02035 [Candidatus Nomurabacteria bacterium RIFCSPHIGHO2_02_FULL_38_15]